LGEDIEGVSYCFAVAIWKGWRGGGGHVGWRYRFSV